MMLFIRAHDVNLLYGQERYVIIINLRTYMHICPVISDCSLFYDSQMFQDTHTEGQIGLVYMPRPIYVCPVHDTDGQ